MTRSEQSRSRSARLLVRAGVIVFLVLCPFLVFAYQDHAALSYARDHGGQSGLPVRNFHVDDAAGRHVADLSLEYANTVIRQNIGMRFRTVIPRGSGMIFVFGGFHEVAMTMDDCPVPEDMIFVGKHGRIVSIASDIPPMKTEPIESGVPVVAVIEIAGGGASRLHIGTSDAFVFSRTSLDSSLAP